MLNSMAWVSQCLWSWGVPGGWCCALPQGSPSPLPLPGWLVGFATGQAAPPIPSSFNFALLRQGTVVRANQIIHPEVLRAGFMCTYVQVHI